VTVSLHAALAKAFDYVIRQGEDVPPDIWSKAIRAGVFKAEADDLAKINAAYHDAITEALLEYLEGGGSVAAPKNMFRRATLTAFGDAFDLGWLDGGGELPLDPDALDWIESRIQQEFGYIEMVFQQAKELRGSDEFEPLTWASERADAYTNTLREVFNNARLRAMKDQSVTFSGTDGEKSCNTCKKLKGKRHKISWFVKRDYVPPHGGGLECAKGGLCQHYLETDEGEQVTI